PDRARPDRMGARGRRPRGRRDPADVDGSRRHPKRVRGGDAARGHGGGVRAGDRQRRGGRAGALRGGVRGRRGGGAGRIGVPLRDARHPRREAGVRRARLSHADMTPDDVKWDEQGLAPAIVQDAVSGEVLMLAWMSRESLQRTLETRLATFWSRSRRELWIKGATSGNTQA